ncbi:MAG: ParB N-terminal domain-containing protein [Halodesulfovibrio sp.]|uniref:ParB N-terminal domain-containing protein n=1 Tax=Halodesulfovibrio sp. TaxID=1912772 RepID=UPI00359D151A
MSLIPTLEKLSISSDKLFLDIKNPRFLGEKGIPTSLSSEYTDAKLQEELRRYLLVKHGVRPLVESISQLGYLAIDNIVVQELEPHKYVVVEGNRRLAAIKTVLGDIKRRVLDVSSSVLSSLAEIEVLVLPKDKCEDFETAAMLLQGVRHISGAKSWGPFQQGRLIEQLVNCEGMTFKDAASTVGLSASRVAVLLRGYYGLKQLMEFPEFAGKADTSMFSYFEYAHLKCPVRQWLEWDDEFCCYMNDENLRFFYQCIIPSSEKNSPVLLSRHVRDYLPTVLEHDEATALFFETRDIRAAYFLATQNNLVSMQRLEELTSSIKQIERIHNISEKELALIAKLNEITTNILKNKN